VQNIYRLATEIFYFYIRAVLYVMEQANMTSGNYVI